MTIAAGTEIYNADYSPVRARGASFSEQELDVALNGTVSRMLWDDSGTDELRVILASVATTDFSDENVKRILNNPLMPENWRVGEAIAEAFLVSHKSCDFPWPSGRDLKNPLASPAGTDLVGFQKVAASGNSFCFVFGEVKTSSHEEWPPSVMNGRHGLQKQLENLRDSKATKDALVRYLGLHAGNSEWLSRFQSAVCRYLAKPEDVSLFGTLIRDVEPKREDLSSRAELLASDCPSETRIELLALYLPRKCISTLAKRVLTAKEGKNGQN